MISYAERNRRSLLPSSEKDGGVKAQVSPPSEPRATVVDPRTLCTVATLTHESRAHHQCDALWPLWAGLGTIE